MIKAIGRGDLCVGIHHSFSRICWARTFDHSDSINFQLSLPSPDIEGIVDRKHLRARYGQEVYHALEVDGLTGIPIRRESLHFTHWSSFVRSE